MPVEVKGVMALRKALNAYAPDLAKELTIEITKSLKVIQKSARGFVPNNAPGGLYNWQFDASRKITAQNSMFKTFNAKGRVRFFPLYNATEIKRGIVYRTGYSKPNSKGFRSHPTRGTLCTTGPYLWPQAQWSRHAWPCVISCMGAG